MSPKGRASLFVFRSSVFGLTLGLIVATGAATSQEEPPERGALGGAPASFSAAKVHSFPAGARILERPAGDAQMLVELEAPQSFEVVEVREEWVGLRFGSRVAWVRREPGSFASEGGAVETGLPGRPRELSSRVARELLESRLERARAVRPSLVEVNGAAASGVRWWLDARLPEKLAARLSATLAAVDDVYQRRYELRLPEQRDPVHVVLFAEQADFAAFASVEGVDRAARGLAVNGLLAIAWLRGESEESHAVLVHEWTHYLNSLLFGDSLPGWLSEGIAEDLSMSRLERGRLVPGTVRGAEVLNVELAGADAVRRGVLETTSGPRWLLSCLAREWQSRPFDVTTILRRHLLFADARERSLFYATAAMAVRTLLDPRWGARTHFLAWLAGATSDRSQLRAHPDKLDLRVLLPTAGLDLTTLSDRIAVRVGFFADQAACDR